MKVPGPQSGNNAAALGSGLPLMALAAALLAIILCWPAVALLVPPETRFTFADIIAEHWLNRHALDPWLERRWAWLAANRYHLWFTLAVLPGSILVGLIAAATVRSFRPVFASFIGWATGAGLGLLLFEGFREESWVLAVLMPPIFSFLGSAIAARLATTNRSVRHIRGTLVKARGAGRFTTRLGAITGRVRLAGVRLSRADETMHVAVVGATGSGKSTALRGLMKDALGRGDRQIVADPDGSAMALFRDAGDIILNPFDRRTAKWDMLGEIQAPGDYAFVAQSLLPQTGTGEHDQWISYAQQLLAGVMENFVRLQLGSSDELITMLSSARIGELRELCAGTPAARFFEEGGERMLASILGTLTPAIASLRTLSAIDSEPFSIRRWVRSGSGTLWMPYGANQIAALRGLISCWLNVAIFETLSLPPSADRRIWFHIDELDALGRIEGLKDGLARLRKFGGSVALGFQSYAQISHIYGENARTIVENCGNLLLLRSGGAGDGGTAKLASDLIGSREVERRDIAHSRTRGKNLSRSASVQPRHLVELAALASEIMQLEQGEGYLKLATKPYWLHISGQ